MLINIRKQKIPFLIIGIIIIYVLQFLVFPKCLSHYYPISNEAWLIFIIPLLTFSMIINILIDVNIVSWAIVDTIYCIMVFTYNGAGLYGIGKRGLPIAGASPSYSLELALITILIITTALFLFQIVVRVIRILFLKIKNWFKFKIF